MGRRFHILGLLAPFSCAFITNSQEWRLYWRMMPLIILRKRCQKVKNVLKVFWAVMNAIETNAIITTSQQPEQHSCTLFLTIGMDVFLLSMLSVSKFKRFLLNFLHGKRFIVYCWVMDALRRLRIVKLTLTTRGITNSLLTSSACSIGIWSTLALLNLIRRIF